MRFRRNALPLVFALAGCGYNASIAADEEVKQSWANVENAYQRRADLIPNLVATVRGSAAHEERVLAEVTRARAEATQVRISPEDLSDPAKLEAFEGAQQRLAASLGRLLAVSESYPDLKANASFRDLQAQLEGTENRIAVERRRYNEAVADYNRIVRQFPTSFGAHLAHLQERAPFRATAPGAERPPKVEF
jgi:LemA protein